MVLNEIFKNWGSHKAHDYCYSVTFSPVLPLSNHLRANITIKTEEGYDPKNAIKYFVTTEKTSSPAVEEDTDGLPF